MIKMLLSPRRDYMPYTDLKVLYGVLYICIVDLQDHLECIVDRTHRRKRERSTYVCFTKSYDLRVTFKFDRKSTSS